MCLECGQGGEKDRSADTSQSDEEEREQQVVLDDQEHEPQRALRCELPLVTEDARHEQQPRPDVAVRQGIGDELAGAVGDREAALPPVVPEAEVASGVTVRTARATYHAERLIITAGPWAGQVLARWGACLTVMRQVLLWFREVLAQLLVFLGILRACQSFGVNL